MTATGTSYLMLPNANAITAPTSTPQTMGDDQTTPVTLPWTFPYQGGGATNTLYVCSNGWVSLESTTATDYAESVADGAGLGDGAG